MKPLEDIDSIINTLTRKDKILVIHHFDSDGKGSAKIWLDYLRSHKIQRRQIDFRSINYGERDNFRLRGEYSLVIITDFSFKASKLKEFLASSKYIIWLDHHIFNDEEILESFIPDSRIIAITSRDFPDMSATKMAWTLLSEKKEIPRWVELVDDFDLQRTGSEESFCFNYGASKEWRTIDDIVISDEGVDRLSRLGRLTYIEGEEIVSEIEGQIQSGALKKTIVADVEVYVLPCHWIFSTQVGNRLSSKFKDDAFLLFYRSAKNPCIIKVSVRRGENSSLDCARFASRWGGGGHEKAAGFCIHDSEFKKLFPDVAFLEVHEHFS